MAEVGPRYRQPAPSRGSKPGERRGGRQKGTANKVTRSVKEAIDLVAQAIGGAERMADWVQEDKQNERLFWSQIYPKLLPLQVAGPSGLASVPRRVIIELDDARS